ncbi:N-acetylglucosamine-6-phosphate deacetylase [Corynebacterium sp. TAE3-ERU2]|uniref:N-acetylglucosamine-6-phosphate deacetylase n=1 Tax=Corynebacterium sp. TAE3-ERU2 TaxID=2849497 RepID=UPI001C47904C|nr:amidohydrolase family protein [Corynebacterium sp. TAE3-ERU2]MBV7302071.1 amidohydrolase family protein [Corynebacterium sp. TAE3-ERU2]
MTEYIGTLIQPGQPGYPARVSIDSSGAAAIERLDEPVDTGLVITPGLADLHNHGGAGFSFPTSSLEECREAALHHRRFGTTTLLASTVSQTREVLLPQLGILASLVEEGSLDGIHAEGPFVNTCRCGAQDPAAIIPGDPEFFREMIEAARGQLRSITFAPETDHARELVDLCVQHDIIVSLGHTDANFDETAAIVDYATSKGAQVTATHLFNAMPSLHHRNPGPIAALLDAASQREDVSVELIADGVHLDNHTVQMVLNTVGYPAATFVSDAMGAAGKADGDYVLGALAVTVRDGVARLRTEDGSEGSIAGGTSRVSDQVRLQSSVGLPLPEVLRSATSGHRLLNLAHRASVSEGPANLVVWDEQMQVREVYREGHRAQA